MGARLEKSRAVRFEKDSGVVITDLRFPPLKLYVGWDLVDFNLNRGLFSGYYGFPTEYSVSLIIFVPYVAMKKKKTHDDDNTYLQIGCEH